MNRDQVDIVSFPTRYYSPVGRGEALLKPQASISYLQSDEETYDMDPRIKMSQIDAIQLSTVLGWFMSSDPFPGNKAEHAALEALLDNESRNHGFDNWIVAYHENKPLPYSPFLGDDDQFGVGA